MPLRFECACNSQAEQAAAAVRTAEQAEHVAKEQLDEAKVPSCS